jgi:hypothetical protein
MSGTCKIIKERCSDIERQTEFVCKNKRKDLIVFYGEMK